MVVAHLILLLSQDYQVLYRTLENKHLPEILDYNI
jgi:hypothetical protein